VAPRYCWLIPCATTLGDPKGGVKQILSDARE
jgi:hypothetical protein